MGTSKEAPFPDYVDGEDTNIWESNKQRLWGNDVCEFRIFPVFVWTLGFTTNKMSPFPFFFQSTVFEYNGTRVCFLGNANNRDAKTINFEGKSYTTPAWSVSILPDCVNVVYNTAEVSIIVYRNKYLGITGIIGLEST